MPIFASAERSRPEGGGGVATVISPANPDILVIAHRGVWTAAPENSIAAIRAAIALGLDMVEIDARMSADGTAVVMHDATLDRTSERVGPVSAQDAGALASTRLRDREGGPDAALTNERIPTLAEALEEARGRILVNIDTKDERDLPAITKLALDLGVAEGVVIKAKIDPAGIAALPEDHPAFSRLPFMPICYTDQDRIAADIKSLKPLRPSMLECHFQTLDDIRAAAGAARPRGIRLWVNTLDCFHAPGLDDSAALGDPAAIWGALADAGVGAIQTDRAAELVAFLVSIGRRRA